MKFKIKSKNKKDQDSAYLSELIMKHPYIAYGIGVNPLPVFDRLMKAVIELEALMGIQIEIRVKNESR